MREIWLPEPIVDQLRDQHRNSSLRSQSGLQEGGYAQRLQVEGRWLISKGH